MKSNKRSRKRNQTGRKKRKKRQFGKSTSISERKIAREKLMKRVLGDEGPSIDKILHEPPGEVKMSEVILEYAEPYLHNIKDDEELLRKAIVIAIACLSSLLENSEIMEGSY